VSQEDLEIVLGFVSEADGERYVYKTVELREALKGAGVQE
jgi:hypothetical protein